MNKRTTAIGLTAVLLLLTVLAAGGPGAAQGTTVQNAESAGDAGNSEGAATVLSGGVTATLKTFSGRLTADTDTADWFRFNIPTQYDQQHGQWVIEVILHSDWAANYNLVLHEPLTQASNPTTSKVADGVGGSGIRYLRHVADSVGTWKIGITGTSTGRYEFAIRLLSENDMGTGRDVRDAVGETNMDNQPATPAGATSDVTLTFSGELYPGDTGDLFSVDNQVQEDLLFVLSFPRAAQARLAVIPPSSGQILNSDRPSRSGVGFDAVFVAAAATGPWGVRVQHQSNTAAYIPYTVAVVRGADRNGDPGGQVDAPSTFDGAVLLPTGLHLGAISTAGRDDLFKIEEVAPGDRLRFGVASFRPTATTNAEDVVRPLLKLELYDRKDSTIPVETVWACEEAGGFIRSAGRDASADNDANTMSTWYVRVTEVSGTGGSQCPQGGVGQRQGNYALLYEKTIQDDLGGGNDARAGIVEAPAVLTAEQPLYGWLDAGDPADAIRLPDAVRGDVMRVHAVSLVGGTEIKVVPYGPNLLATGDPVSAESSGGAARIHRSATDSGSHYIIVERRGVSIAAGPYMLLVRNAGDAPPLPVTLNAPSNVQRTSMLLTWTQAIDNDLVRYEVHASTTPNFTPGPSTLRQSIADRKTVSYSLQGLTGGTTYHILIRVVDFAGTTADSNRRTQETDPFGLQNNPPQLSDGKVNPQEGVAGQTSFTFSVVYMDADGEVPTLRRVWINAEPFSMSPAGGSTPSAQQVRDGHSYQLQTTLTQGNKNFYFEFSDGTATVRNPRVNDHPGPVVAGEGNRPPAVTASANTTEGEAPLHVQFAAQASDPDGDSLSYQWDFDTSNGFQAQSTETNPMHVYEQPGTYQAQVVVRDSGGASSGSSVTIQVLVPSNEPPTTQPTALPESGEAPLDVQFRANAIDPDGSIVAHSWDFDNSDGLQTESDQAAPLHRYTRAGSFTATVTVRDDGGRTATGSVTVTVRSENNLPPSVFVDFAPDGGPAPLLIDFSAEAVDPDGQEVTVTWDFDRSDGIQVDATGVTVQHVYGAAGTYTATATAQDTEGATATATARVRVDAAQSGNEPVQTSSGVLFIEAVPRSGRVPLDVTFTADTSGLDAPASTYEWDFGDGSVSTEGPTVRHQFTTDGLFRITLGVTDESGAVAQSTIDVEVRSGSSPGIGAIAAMGAVAVALWAWRRSPGKD